MTTKIKYGAGNTNCNCQVVVIYEATYGENEVYDYEIEYCPLHEAAPQMFEALENLCRETKKAHADRNNLTPGCAVCDAIKAGEQVLAAAGGVGG